MLFTCACAQYKYLMDKAYVDFEALFSINQTDAFFVTRAKASLKYETIEENFNIDQEQTKQSR